MSSYSYSQVSSDSSVEVPKEIKAIDHNTKVLSQRPHSDSPLQITLPTGVIRVNEMESDLSEEPEVLARLI
jgi:hypothetical protein